MKIIMAYPESTIYEVKDALKEVKYEDTEHYQIMRNFINNRDKMINILMD